MFTIRLAAWVDCRSTRVNNQAPFIFPHPIQSCNCCSSTLQDWRTRHRGAKRHFHLQMSTPFTTQRLFHPLRDPFLGYMWPHMIFDPYDSMAGYSEFIDHFILQWIIVWFTVLDCDLCPKKGFDKGCFTRVGLDWIYFHLSVHWSSKLWGGYRGNWQNRS